MDRIESLEFTHPVSCYNGCYDSKTQRVLDEQERVLRLIQRLEPEAHTTYFPMEGKTMVHVWGRDISGLCSSRGSAILSAYNRIYPNAK